MRETGGAMPVIDWTHHPAVVRARGRDRFRTAIYTGLAFSATAIIVAISLLDGLHPIDTLYFAVASLVAFFGASAMSSLIGFEAVNTGLRVYPDGFSLPWRSMEAARRGEENFLPFRLIAEIQPVSTKGRRGLLVVRHGEQKPHEFLIEPEWIPDIEALLDSIRGKVHVREDRDAT